jgi:hypothetical protein
MPGRQASSSPGFLFYKNIFWTFTVFCHTVFRRSAFALDVFGSRKRALGPDDGWANAWQRGSERRLAVDVSEVFSEETHFQIFLLATR